MSFINYAAREINVKIVFYGPGLCGKTTNLQYIYEKSNPQQKGKLISPATETDRTQFFDFLPLDLGSVRGFKTRFHLYTVPGQPIYNQTRKIVLTGVDGLATVEAVLPEIVKDAAIGDGYKTVDYSRLVPLLVEAIKEQQDQIDDLKSEIKALKG